MPADAPEAQVMVQVESNPDWFLAALRGQWGRIRHNHSTRLSSVVNADEVTLKLDCSCRKEPLGQITQTIQFVDGWPNVAQEIVGLWSDNLYWRHAINMLLEIGTGD